MTTDNRTNELNQNETKSGQAFCFTEVQVEAAAKAIADCHNPGMFEKYPENWRVEARAALVAAAEVTPPEEGKLRQLIADLVGEDDCYFDHHGGCQTHGYISLKPGEMCPHQEGKEWLGE